MAQSNLSDTLETYKLRGKPYQTWDSLEKLWQQDLSKLFKKHHIVMSCASCSRVIAKGIFHIDSLGKCTMVFTEKLVTCGGQPMSPSFQKDFFDFWFHKTVFPAELRNRYLKVSLGRVLKC